ncbi:MAG: dTMP kinase [Acidobacteria bacterium]|nr:dTMP kinase [Acidobacteriota bacterium]
MFITFEGVEGSGKTTQISLLCQYLSKKKVEFVSTREPGGSPIGESLRKILLSDESKIDTKTELLLYLAERAEHIEKVIKPNLEKGKIVICDRFSDATRAYQIFGRQLQRNVVESLIEFATDGLEPDLTILLKLDPKTALTRARARNSQSLFSEGRFEAEELDFHKRVYEGYETLARESRGRIKVVNANGDPGEVFQSVLKILILCGVVSEG